ncbi:glutamate racemase [Thalassotalea insulae]|uniref:Glutamate racemase n=1 Tax=Thalassotalea insulae TaxID=2056778 RepID=A0ABQ6GRH4_9GAMM|nr:glutamate racemase [Thalassotalea insulae]GLX77020.1 glutamate racemase [Thalassotalea insulae]
MTDNSQQPINLTSAIGIFDSGVGGLSIAKCIAEQLPNENLIYLADSAYAPYGDISVAEIKTRVTLVARWLMQQQCKALVVACNTATVNVIEQLRNEISLPIIGVEPAIKPAAKQSKSKKVAILATQATATNKRFLDLVEKYKNGSEVFIQPCPGLVELIEQGLANSTQCKELLATYLNPLMQQQVDTLVLGCTHYPFVSNTIKQLVGSDIKLIETAAPVTQQLHRQLALHQLLTTNTTPGQHHFYSSLATPQQQVIFNKLWQNDLPLRPFESI